MVKEMKVTMAHGSGGKDSGELMTRIFGKYFQNDILDRMEDAAILTAEGKIAVSTDSFVVTPLEFKGGDIGKLCVCGTVNDLLVMGATPQYLTCGFILEEGLPLDLLERLVLSMSEEASKAGVKIVAGDTKVVEGRGGLYINTTGIGVVPQERNISASNCRAGDRVILSGTLGDHHACILSARMDIENNISSDCACLKDITDSLFSNRIPIKAMRDVTRGGLGTVLNEVANSSQCRIKIREKDLPVEEEVRSFSDILGLDPLYMGNEGKMIIIVPKEQGDLALEAIRKTENGKNAAIIGEVEEGNGVVMVTALGGSRRVDVLYGEGLPRIC